MAAIKITSKRQATLPVALCKSMGVRAGDELEVLPRVVGGQRLWTLQPRHRPRRSWLGSLCRYAEDPSLDHGMDAIRASIVRGGRTD